MDTEQFKELERIYHEAVELPDADRRSFLETACAGDPELFAEIESLIALDAPHDDFLESSPRQLVAELIGEIGEPPNLVGTSLGHFEIVELLGKGGMGEVYRATDTKLHRKVALKFLPPELVANTDRMNRFIREARAISALNHPNIITIYDVNEVAGKHFIATEYIEGKTLRQFAGGRPIEAVQALEIAIQIASALGEAHSARIAHRDIKPDNIMIRPNGLVKILDFGIAKVGNELEPAAEPENDIDGDTPIAATRSGVILGTADYVSPEQARGSDVDTRTDIFSFGIVLYELLEGRTPFTGETAHATIGAILNDEPRSTSIESPEIRRLLTRCLEKDRENRYQTADELLADLRTARRSVDARNARPTAEVSVSKADPVIARQTDERATSDHARMRAPIPGTIKWAALTAVVAIIAVVFGYGYLGRSRQIRSIAVMPFINESANPEIEYLSDGITESLIRRLSNIPNLSVKARSSVFTFKGKNLDAKLIGDELNVDAVLIGRLTRNGDDLTLRLELVESATRDVLWTDSYQRRMADLATLSGEIASDVSEKLRLRLTSAQQERVAKSSTVSSEAQRLYLKGRFHWNKRNARDFQRAIAYFQQAIEIDPNYALAYAGLADTLALMPLYGDRSPKEYMPQAKNAALKALELDENLAEAHASLGYVFNTFEYDWVSAGREYRIAIKMNPNYATARQWYAEHLAFTGDSEGALEQITAAIELDPLSLIINRMRGNILLFAGRYDEARAQFEKAIEMYPENAMLRFNLGDLEAARGKPADAVGEYLVALKFDGYDQTLREELYKAFRRDGVKGFWRKYRDQQESFRRAILDKDPAAYFDDESLAFAYAMTGDGEKTIEYLNRAYEARNPVLITIGQSHVYDFLRDDPRFGKVLQDVGLSRGE